MVLRARKETRRTQVVWGDIRYIYIYINGHTMVIRKWSYVIMVMTIINILSLMVVGCDYSHTYFLSKKVAD